MRVDIADWVVPVLYHNSGTEVELLGDDEDKLFLGKIKNPKAKSAISEFLHALGETTSNHGRSQSHQGLRKRSKSSEDLVIGEVIPGNEMLGRDGDIFELETRFLMENNVIRLQGVPGAGIFSNGEIFLRVSANNLQAKPPSHVIFAGGGSRHR